MIAKSSMSLSKRGWLGQHIPIDVDLSAPGVRAGSGTLRVRVFVQAAVTPAARAAGISRRM